MTPKRIGRIGLAITVSVGTLLGYVLFQALVLVCFFVFVRIGFDGTQEQIMSIYARHMAEVYLVSAFGYAIILVAGLLVYKVLKRNSFTDFLKLPGRTGPYFGLPAAFFLGATFNLFLSNLIPMIPFKEEWIAENAESVGAFDDSGLLFMLIAHSLAAPLVEELIFRGIIYTGLRKAPILANRGLCIVFSAVLVSVVFGWFHGNALQALYCFCFSLILVWLMERTGSVWYPVATHVGFNTPWIVLIFLLPWYEEKAYLLNTVIFGIVCLGIGIFMALTSCSKRCATSQSGDADTVNGGGHDATCVSGPFSDGE